MEFNKTIKQAFGQASTFAGISAQLTILGAVVPSPFNIVCFVGAFVTATMAIILKEGSKPDGDENV